MDNEDAEASPAPEEHDLTLDLGDLWPRRERRQLGRRGHREVEAIEPSTWRQRIPLLVLVALYVGYFSYESLRLYATYNYPPFDLAIFDQGMWLLSHFHAPFVTIMGRNLFGDHTSFILLLLVPVYRLVPEPQGLLVLQTLAIGAAALPIFALARRASRSVGIATAMAAVYLLSPALQQVNLEQFHPEGLQVLVFTLAIYAAVESRGRLLAVMVLLTLLTKEDAALLVVPLGLWVAARRDRRWGVYIVVAGVAYAVVANAWVIPAFLGGSTLYAGRIPFGGVSGFLRTLLTRPRQVWQLLHSEGRLFYLWQMGLSAGWLFVLAPEMAALALLAFLENELSVDPYMHQIFYHYSLRIVPVLVVGTAWAIGRRRRRWLRAATTLGTLTCAVVSCVWWGLAPFSRSPEPIDDAAGAAVATAMTHLVTDLPANASVSALYPLVSHIDHRQHIYVWPAPFVPSNWGLPATASQTLPPPFSVTYLILPGRLGAGNDADIFTSISSAYYVRARFGGYVLYERHKGGPPPGAT